MEEKGVDEEKEEGIKENGKNESDRKRDMRERMKENGKGRKHERKRDK